VKKLSSTASKVIISLLKACCYQRMGPSISQLNLETLNILLVSNIKQTSSPYHPQGNGEVERAVKTVKKLLNDSGF